MPWLGATRLQVAATCLGRAERALGHAKQYAVDRVQFGQQIGKFQGVSFKLADMATELKAAELMIFEAALEIRSGHSARNMDMAMAKLKATEMLAYRRRRSDPDPRRHGPDGATCRWSASGATPASSASGKARREIQRHIISRALLRPLGG